MQACNQRSFKNQYCWVGTTKKSLHSHQTLFLVRGRGLGTRLSIWSLTVVCKSLVSEQNLKIWRCPIRIEVMSFVIVLIGQCWITTALLLTRDLQTTVSNTGGGNGLGTRLHTLYVTITNWSDSAPLSGIYPGEVPRPCLFFWTWSWTNYVHPEVLEILVTTCVLYERRDILPMKNANGLDLVQRILRRLSCSSQCYATRNLAKLFHCRTTEAKSTCIDCFPS